jgi:PAS domain S-box-containing protein
MRDCTEQLRSRARLQAWESRFYDAMDGLHVPVVELDAQGALQYWNDSAAALCNRARASLVRHRWIDVCVAPDDRARVNGMLRDILIGESMPAPVSFALLDPQGGPSFPVRWTIRALFGEGEVPVGIAFMGETPHPPGGHRS